MGIFYPNCGNSTGRSGARKLSFSAVAAAHIAILGLLATVVPAERLTEPAHPIAVRLIELAPETPALPPPPPPKPVARTPVHRAPPIVAAVSPVASTAPVAFTVAPQPPAPASVAAPAPAPEPTFIAARFDADYLDNPKPSYPRHSRRLGEEGKVLLRVHVSAEGLPETIELRCGSGFHRLDEAAQETVAHWRFVPAKRGDQAVTSWVLVPIEFSLKSES